ncbi:MAG: hypothetical protein JO033_03095 [Acidobacteriaceae bacterium]|nr:hypothetical protein [Acidobacteriaceae bacterium]MBV9502391.1 hypothetical protein [Acidobacteriaceae bacterium]
MMNQAVKMFGIAVLTVFTATAAENANTNADTNTGTDPSNGSEIPRFEASVDYTFAHLNPARNLLKTKNVNGGGGAFQVNFGNWLGIKGDLQGYGSHQYNFTIPAGTTLPNGTVTTNPVLYNVQGNLFTYTFGPVIKKHTGRFQPFGEVLLGAAHSNVYANLFKTAVFKSASPNNNGFAMVVGGGIDLRLSHTITFRPAECDYLLTRFGSNFQPPPNSGYPSISTQNQNSFRYLAGVDFTWGGR